MKQIRLNNYRQAAQLDELQRAAQFQQLQDARFAVLLAELDGLLDLDTIHALHQLAERNPKAVS